MNPGKVVDSSAHALAAVVRTCGATPERLGVARDSTAEIQALLERGLALDAVITTGGVSVGDRDLMTVETSRGAEQTISTAKYEVTGRGGKGRELLQRGSFVRVIPGEVVLQGIPEA